MLTVKNQSLVNQAILENAYGISYEKTFNELWGASFSLPLNDEKNKYCNSLHYIEIVDEEEYIGLFRIIPKKTLKNESNKEVTYQLEHVLATLLDKSIFGYKQTTNLSTRENLQMLIDQQVVKHWKLGRVDFTRYFSYKWENANVLSAIFSIPEVFDVDYQWTWDTQSYPWTLNLVEVETEPTCEIRERYNLIGLEVTENPMGIYNRIYPLGYGEGDNQLTIKSVNNGIPYVEDTEAIKQLGFVKEYIWADTRFEDPNSLMASAKGLLKEWKKPKVTWNVSAAELSRITGLSKDKFRIGKVVRINVDDFPTTDLRIMKESKPDVTGEPWNVSLTLGHLDDDLGTTQKDLERRQQINELYAQGATNISNYSYNDNADSENPAEILVYFPDEIVRLNKAILSYKTDKFRAYERAIKGGGAVVKSTSSGGGTTATSSSGGGTTATSSSGGGVSKSTESGGSTTQTSQAGGDHYHLMFEGGNAVEHDESMDREFYANASSSGGATARVVMGGTIANSLYTRGSSGNHSHSVSIPAHSHEFNTPNHTHNVTVPNHEHNVTIPNHTHEIQLPDHTHEIEFGIFKLNELPSKVTITVDGNTVPVADLNGDNIDLIPYLSKSGGKVNRGWHSILITPDNLGRINAQIYTQFFIQSRGEGEY
ncbi:phage tail spike protein [Niallia circulans]|uniref:phage tail spike protein n=1 Tax=Niallia circulans TaxID=1397 RepID=UPI002E245E32|nr:phage tail spike protein [Niallia circulans]MED5102432.1 phage tail spike protein [Niallia circulans]